MSSSLPLIEIGIKIFHPPIFSCAFYYGYTLKKETLTPKNFLRGANVIRENEYSCEYKCVS